MNDTRRWWMGRALAGLFFCVVVGLASPVGPADTVLTFSPVADTTIRASEPTRNFGSSTLLESDGSPLQHFLMRFVVTGIGSQTVRSAKLRLYSVNSSDRGGDFRRVADNTWAENTATWGNAPPADAAVLATLGAVSSGGWYEVDLTAAITGDGTYSFRISSPSDDGAQYRSKEAEAAVRPQLVVTVAPGSAQTLTFTPTDDATIRAGSAATNYGTATTLETDDSPRSHFLLKFTVAGVGCRPVASAKVRLYSVGESASGGAFRRVADSNWLEHAVTWNTAPAADATPIATLGAVTSGRWYEVDLTSLVRGDGTYSLRVTTTSDDGADYRSKEGGAATSPQLIVVVGTGGGAPGPLSASAGPDQYGDEGTSFRFTGSATGGTCPHSFAWTFGDGTSASGSSVTHVYRDNGKFTVTLKATDSTGQAVSDQATATVSNVAPTANAGGPYSGVVDRSITFSGSATDPGAADTAAGFKYVWNFGDGDTSSSRSPSHSYDDDGTYTVRLTATDKDGASDSDTTTAVVSKASSGFVVTAAGDYGASSRTTAVLQRIVPSGSNLHLALGDLSYGGLSSELAWCAYVQSHVGATFPFELIAGNHEEDGIASGFIGNFAACLPHRAGGLSGTYAKQYYFDYRGLARFILIGADLTLDDVTYDYSAGSSKYDWVASAIDGARAAGIPWVIVGMHKVCLTAGKYSCSVGTALMNLLIRKRVDLVLQAHDHTYQRSKQLAQGSDCTTVPTSSVDSDCIVDDGADGQYTKGRGTVFVIVGTGGAGLYSVSTGDTQAGYFARLMGANSSNPSWGFLKATVTGTALSAEFLPAVGTFTDHFTITAP